MRQVCGTCGTLKATQYIRTRACAHTHGELVPDKVPHVPHFGVSRFEGIAYVRTKVPHEVPQRFRTADGEIAVKHLFAMT